MDWWVSIRILESGDQLPELLHGTRKHTHTAAAGLRFRASSRGICYGKVGHGTVSFSDYRGHWATSRKVGGSIPDGGLEIFH